MVLSLKRKDWKTAFVSKKKKAEVLRLFREMAEVLRLFREKAEVLRLFREMDEELRLFMEMDAICDSFLIK